GGAEVLEELGAGAPGEVVVHHEQVDGQVDARGDLEGLLGGGGVSDFVAERGEHGGEQAADQLVVLGEEGEAAGDKAGLLGAGLDPDGGGLGEREGDGEGGAGAGGGIDADFTGVVVDDAMDDGQAQACAAPAG